MASSKGGTAETATSSAAAAPRRRFGEPWKFVPVIFVVLTIGCLYVVYVSCHIWPMLQLGTPKALVVTESQRRGWQQLVIFHVITILLLVCYVRSILVNPGEIPEQDPAWEYLAVDGQSNAEPPPGVQENKRSKPGERRHCKWCGKYKPDRCHHCRVCKTCVLKMDHHCPWIYNCVGFANYKDFYLLLLYTAIDCWFMVGTMAESVVNAVTKPSDMPFLAMSSIFFGVALSSFLGFLVTCFLIFHTWLVANARTTIEFCEKTLPKKDKEKSQTWSKVTASLDSPYDMGLYGNFKVILGRNPVCWLLPGISTPIGDGLDFISDETRLTMDMDYPNCPRRRTHQRTQRPPYGRDYSDVTGYGSTQRGGVSIQGGGAMQTSRSDESASSQGPLAKADKPHSEYWDTRSAASEKGASRKQSEEP